MRIIQRCCKGHRGGNEEALAMQWLCNEGELSGNGVVTGAAPGMAAADAFDSQPAAFENTVFEDGLHHILAAGRGVPA